jgi:hypothetical protein
MTTKVKKYLWNPTQTRDSQIKQDKFLADENEGDDSSKCMWIRDLLVPLFPEARIATYSYKSDWRDRNVKTNLRECAQLFLNVLKQNREHENVSG